MKAAEGAGGLEGFAGETSTGRDWRDACTRPVVLNAKIRDQDAVVRGQDMYFMGWDGWMDDFKHALPRQSSDACLLGADSGCR